MTTGLFLWAANNAVWIPRLIALITRNNDCSVPAKRNELAALLLESLRTLAGCIIQPEVIQESIVPGIQMLLSPRDDGTCDLTAEQRTLAQNTLHEYQGLLLPVGPPVDVTSMGSGGSTPSSVRLSSRAMAVLRKLKLKKRPSATATSPPSGSQ